MRRPILFACIAALVITAVPLAGTAGPVPVMLRKHKDGVFTSLCNFSHRAPDDPIVKFGQPGASHSHDFFGSSDTDAYSTYNSMRAGYTSCNNRPADTAGYWVPTLLNNGQPVQPLRLNAYYRTRDKAAKSIEPFPAGLKIVAGNSTATTAQSTDIVRWSCYGSDAPPSATVPTCKEGKPLRLEILFPDCWNGQALDWSDHKSHMAYSSRGWCPSGYGVSMPGLELTLLYPVTGGSSVTLASGSALTGHADFFNTWDQKELAKLVRECLNERRPCKASEPGITLPYSR
jgi:uncharacterized protein DUF1996